MPEKTVKKRNQQTGEVDLYRQDIDEDGVVVSENLIGPAKGVETRGSGESVERFLRQSGIKAERQGNRLVVKSVPKDFFAIISMFNLDKPCEIPGCEALRREYSAMVEREKKTTECPDEKGGCLERAIQRKLYPKAKELYERWKDS